MIVRVSKNLKGSVSVPSLSQNGITANQSFYIDDTIPLKQDVQNALLKRLLVVSGKDAAKIGKVIHITNISNGSVTVPGLGTIPSGKTKSVLEAAVDKKILNEIKETGLVKVSNRIEVEKRKRGRPRKTQPQERDKKDGSWNPVAWNPLTEDNEIATKELPQRLGSKDGIVAYDPREESPEINDDDSGHEDSGITWVDREDEKRRIAAHPVLGKLKNAHNRKR